MVVKVAIYLNHDCTIILLLAMLEVVYKALYLHARREDIYSQFALQQLVGMQVVCIDLH